MAEGDLITLSNQYEFNGLLLGRATPRITSDVEGLLSTPELLEIDQERQDAPGMFGQVAYPSARIVDFDVSGHYGSALLAETARDLLERAFLIEEGVYRKFCFSRPFYPNRFFWAQCRRRHFVSNYEVAHGLLTGSVRMFGADPRIYALAETSQSLFVGSGSLTGSTSVNNPGNYKAPVTITIPGPATNPVVTNSTTGRAIRLNVVLSGGNTLTLDSKTQSVKLNGAEQFHLLSNDNQWWSLAPGSNTIVVSRQDGSAQITCTINHRGTWM